MLQFVLTFNARHTQAPRYRWAPLFGLDTLDGKIKIPFSLVDTDRFELKPYFFAGAGVRQDGFSGLNAGATASLKLKLFDLGPSGLTLGVEADGGAKYLYDVDSG